MQTLIYQLRQRHAAKTCDLIAQNQARFTDSINRVNQSPLSLYQQKRLANQYQLQTASLGNKPVSNISTKTR